MIHAKNYIPLVIVIDRPEEASRVRRMSEYTISFAVENIMQEVLEADHSLFISRYSHKEIVILFVATSLPKITRQSITPFKMQPLRFRNILNFLSLAYLALRRAVLRKFAEHCSGC